MIEEAPIGQRFPDFSDLPSIDALTKKADRERTRYTGARPRLRTQVALVARMMDKDNPAWFTLVNPDKLNMQSYQMCALGQPYGHYDRGRHKLEEAFDAYHLWHQAVDATRSVTTVTRYWREEIRLRTRRLAQMEVQSEGTPE